MLQAKVLRNKNASMRTNDPRAFLLYTTVSILLESPEQRPTNHLGRNETAGMGLTGRNC
jgi:hypothetical protein